MDITKISAPTLTLYPKFEQVDPNKIPALKEKIVTAFDTPPTKAFMIFLDSILGVVEVLDDPDFIQRQPPSYVLRQQKPPTTLAKIYADRQKKYKGNLEFAKTYIEASREFKSISTVVKVLESEGYYRILMLAFPEYLN